MTEKQYCLYLQNYFDKTKTPLDKMVFLTEAKAKKLAKDPKLRPYLRRISLIISPYLEKV